MTVKHRGGRGRRALNKHETVTISLPPHLKAALDAAVTPEVSRSEVVAQLIDQHLYLSTAQAQSQLQVPRKAKRVPAASRVMPKPKSRPSRAKSTPPLPFAVTVISQRVDRGIKWKPERYAEAERLLAQGHTLKRMADGADYITETGESMSWRTVSALIKMGVLVELI